MKYHRTIAASPIGTKSEKEGGVDRIIGWLTSDRECNSAQPSKHHPSITYALPDILRDYVKHTSLAISSTRECSKLMTTIGYDFSQRIRHPSCFLTRIPTHTLYDFDCRLPSRCNTCRATLLANGCTTPPSEIFRWNSLLRSDLSQSPRSTSLGPYLTQITRTMI